LQQSMSSQSELVPNDGDNENQDMTVCISEKGFGTFTKKSE